MDICKWIELEKHCYYQLDKIRYEQSKFSGNDVVPIGMINGKQYLFPKSTFTYIQCIEETPIILFAGGKKKMVNSKHKSWAVDFYYCHNSLMKQIFWELEYGFRKFLTKHKSIELVEEYNNLSQKNL